MTVLTSQASSQKKSWFLPWLLSQITVYEELSQYE